MADQILRPRSWSAAGRAATSRRSARAQLGMKVAVRRARASRRHLPQLGLHPDQGAAALLGDQPPAASPRRIRFRRRQHPLRPDEGGEALARRRQAALQRRRLPDEEEQGHGVRRPWQAGRQGQAGGREGRQAGRRPSRPSTSSSPPARGRAQLPGLEPDGKLIWTYKEAMVPDRHAEIAAGHRLRAPSASSSPASTATSAPR